MKASAYPVSGIVLVLLLVLATAGAPMPAWAAPYAAMVMDARSGQVLHSRNADTRLHPASLTKMMTLYIAFEAVSNGEISLDSEVVISAKAAAEPPSRLGLRTGQRIALRYLIRAAALRSANDAATAIGEAISGSEAAFLERMNRTARAMGMNNTTFRNAHGLTAEGHLSTARDMTILGRHLLFDYPQYYNLFSRTSEDAGIARVPNTNRRLLADYQGADGIKTGFTRAAGFNLTASAERGSKRIIVTVFGGRSAVARNQRVAELLDLGFREAPAHVALARPVPPRYEGPGAGRQVAASGLVARSPRPRPRPSLSLEALVAIAREVEQTVIRLESETVLRSDSEIAEDMSEFEAGVEFAAIQAVEAESDALPRALAFLQPPRQEPVEPGGDVIVRASTSGGRYWGVSLGLQPTRDHAERILLTAALMEIDSLEGALRKVVPARGRFEATFVGLAREEAERACLRLRARRTACETVGPAEG